jgi:hypothetical protein
VWAVWGRHTPVRALVHQLAALAVDARMQLGEAARHVPGVAAQHHRVPGEDARGVVQNDHLRERVRRHLSRGGQVEGGRPQWVFRVRGG